MKDHIESVKTPAEKIAEIIRTNSKKIILFSFLVILVLIFIAVMDIVSSKKEEKALLQAEKIEEAYTQWQNSADADKQNVSENLLTLIEESQNRFEGTYAALRATYTKGLYLAEMEKWDESMEAFLSVSREFSDSYLAPVALFNAASISDQAGDKEKALSLFESINTQYATVSADIPEVLFNIGRLNEELGKADKALENYQRIIDEYSSSSWTNIAKSRIISININS